MLHNIRRICPLLRVRVLVQVLVQTLVVISCLDYCPSLLAGRPAAALRPLQLIQKPAAPLVFNLSSLTLLRSLHWLPVAASAFKTLVLGTVLGTDQVQSISRTWSNLTPPPVHSALHRPISCSLTARDSCHSTTSQLFPVLAPKRWNQLHMDMRTGSPHVFLQTEDASLHTTDK